MTLKAYIVRFLNKKIAFILFIAAALRLYKIEALFAFDFDQEIPAIAAYEFFINHKISLIGQELSHEGIFLGPLHNWIQFIPYGLCGLLPDCTPYLYVLLGLGTIAVLYIVVKVIFDAQIAAIASIIYAISFYAISVETGVNSNYFLLASSVGILFCLFKYFGGQNKYLVIGAIISGIATVNFNPVFIFSSLAFFITAAFRTKRSFGIFLLAVVAFTINYLPLLIFNFRHQNLLFNSFTSFSQQSPAPFLVLEKFKFILVNIFVPFYTNFLFLNNHLIFQIVAVITLIVGLVTVVKSKNRFLFFLPIWIATPIVGFNFYNGHISDYYFLQIILPALILTSLSLKLNIIFYILFLAVFIWSNIIHLVNYNSPVNYQIKKQAVLSVINNTSYESFKVYYDMPSGFNTGYSYLFKVLKTEPVEGGKNLYILKFIDPRLLNKQKYYREFTNKQIDIRSYGFVNVVSIK